MRFHSKLKTSFDCTPKTIKIFIISKILLIFISKFLISKHKFVFLLERCFWILITRDWKNVCASLIDFDQLLRQCFRLFVVHILK